MQFLLQTKLGKRVFTQQILDKNNVRNCSYLDILKGTDEILFCKYSRNCGEARSGYLGSSTSLTSPQRVH